MNIAILAPDQFNYPEMRKRLLAQSSNVRFLPNRNVRW